MLGALWPALQSWAANRLSVLRISLAVPRSRRWPLAVGDSGSMVKFFMLHCQADYEFHSPTLATHRNSMPTQRFGLRRNDQACLPA
jgi:hypothetical protein